MSSQGGFSPFDSKRAVAIILGAREFPRATSLELHGARFLNSALAFRTYLVEKLRIPRRCILDLFDDFASPSEMLSRIGLFLAERMVEMKDDPLLDVFIYYVGHGFLEGPGVSELSLAIRQTNTEDLSLTTLEMRLLATAVRSRTRFSRRYVILDCCYSGAASRVWSQADGAASIAKRETIRFFPKESPTRGTAVLSAAESDVEARAVGKNGLTAFSDGLIQCLDTGRADLGQQMSLQQVHWLVLQYLKDNYPDNGSYARPKIDSPEAAEGDVAWLPIFPNPAHSRLSDAEQEWLRQEQPDREWMEHERLKANSSPSKAVGVRKDPDMGPPPKFSFLELLTSGLAAGSSVVSVSWLLYYKGFPTLIAGTLSLAGALSLIVFLASAGAYCLWKKATWGTIRPKSERAKAKVLLIGLLVGSLAYSATLFSKASVPVGSEVVLSIVNENTGRPVSAASIKGVSPAGESVAEGLSNANGIARLIVPSGLSSSEITFFVQHQGYQDGELVTLPKPGITERVQLLPNASPPLFKSRFKFNGLPITVSLNKELTQFNYGYSSLESDPTVIGQNVRITKVRIDLSVLVHSGDAVGNVDVLLGPGPTIFRPGPVSESHYDNVERSTRRAPVQAHFVVGRKPIRIGEVVDYYATYDFETRQPGGDSTNGDATDEKDFLAPTISLPKGLFAQVVLWNGSAGGVNEDIKRLSLDVEGTNQGSNN